MHAQVCFQIVPMWLRGDYDDRLPGCKPGAREATHRVEKMRVFVIHQYTMVGRTYGAPVWRRHWGIDDRLLVGAQRAMLCRSTRYD